METKRHKDKAMWQWKPKDVSTSKGMPRIAKKNPDAREKKKKKSDNSKCWKGYEATGSIMCYWWEYKLVQSLCEQFGITFES